MTKEHLCPETPGELGLDAPSWWPGQRDTIELIVAALLEKKYVMAGIPTGGGKTIIASAVQRILGHVGGGQWGGDSLALTHTIQLQKQYQRTLKDAKVITGRSNHPCELPMDDEHRIGYDEKVQLTADEAPCNGGPCPADLKGPNGCAYYKQWWEAARSPMVVMNYAFATRILQQEYFAGEDGEPMANPFRRTLLVADECHLTEKAIMESAGFKLWNAQVQKAGLQFPNENTKIRVEESATKIVYYENIAVWVAWARTAMNPVNSLVHEYGGAVVSLLRAHKENPTSANSRAVAKSRGELKRMQSFYGSIKDLAEITDEKQAEWNVSRERSSDGKYVLAAMVKPVWGWTNANTALFNHFDKVLLMSATPGDPEVARVTLGIPKAEFEYIERPSTFPVVNRPVYFWDVAKLNYQSSDAEWMKIAKAIGYIAMNEPYVSRKGIVHSGSHKNAQRLVGLLNSFIPGKRFFTHGTATGDLSREAALDEFVSSPEPRVLVTASFTTGLDLPYIIGWQVIAKAPFGSLGDEITARRRAFKLANGYAFGQQVYESECMNTVVQAAGRIVRAPDDSGPTFILDSNYALLHTKAYRPRFYTDAYKRLQWEGGSSSGLKSS